MKSIILFAILVTTICGSDVSNGPFQLELLEPHGFRILRPGSSLLRHVNFRGGSIRGEIEGPQDSIPASPFKRQDDGLWVYENANVTLHPGDTLSYEIDELEGTCGLIYIEEFHVPSVYNLLGETLSRLQQYAEAERWFQASLASQPDHVPAHITYGKLLARNSSRVLEAERWFLRAQRLAPQDSSVHHHYGVFLSSQGRLTEAAEQHLKAAELSPKDYELAVAGASALRQADRRAEAETWYRHAAGLRPQEARSHTNLGAILHLNGKYKQAAAAYREALRLQPGDATTLTNLHKLAALLA